jgi:hypothetical protein
MEIMVSGADMLKHWLKRNPAATLAQIEVVKQRFPKRKFFKVLVPVEAQQKGVQ